MLCKVSVEDQEIIIMCLRRIAGWGITSFLSLSLSVATLAAGGQTNSPVADQLAELDKEEAGEKLRHSFAGRMGHWIEPAIRPLLSDWAK